MNILEKIVARKKIEVAELKQRGIMPSSPPAFEKCRSLAAALFREPYPRVIAEVKKASPSAGLLSADFDPPSLATAYEKGGAAALSVVTDEHFFKGDISWLASLRSLVELPLLRKDFIIDPLQVRESRAAGADAILLIAAILSRDELRELLDIAADQGLECLVEVHDEKELEKVLSTPAVIIGINNRNLKDFTIDLETTLRLRKLIPENRLVVSESGIDHHAQLIRLAAAGVQGVLVGTSLVKSGDPTSTLQKLIRGE
ncbi:MAG: indole-3-glycerol phosphate synthase TrpC [Pseudomonadota bacterium]|nr:indole-3-glycerol phosphate synthase TrpC [Pseudomonadota bacterium]